MDNDDEPLTQDERQQEADDILDLIRCGRYNVDRKDSSVIGDLLLVIERMDGRIMELENSR